MNYSQVKEESAKELSDLAKMRGIPHEVQKYEENDTRVTFSFNNGFTKMSFDEMAKSHGHTILGDSLTTQMLDAVCEGQEASSVLDKLVG